jgi:hypothetical protein
MPAPRMPRFVLLVAAAGCAHPGVFMGGARCPGGARALDPDERAVLAAVVESVYRSGHLTVARATLADASWLDATRDAAGDEELRRDFAARNAAPGCLELDAGERLVDLPHPGPRERIALSRPGLDGARQAAIVVYELRGDEQPEGPETVFASLRKRHGEWSVVHAVVQTP